MQVLQKTYQQECESYFGSWLIDPGRHGETMIVKRTLMLLVAGFVLAGAVVPAQAQNHRHRHCWNSHGHRHCSYR
jgi:hypothetical protein